MKSIVEGKLRSSFFEDTARDAVDRWISDSLMWIGENVGTVYHISPLNVRIKKSIKGRNYPVVSFNVNLIGDYKNGNIVYTLSFSRDEKYEKRIKWNDSPDVIPGWITKMMQEKADAA